MTDQWEGKGFGWQNMFVPPAQARGTRAPSTASGTCSSDVELRQVLVHLVEEYARHLGHADLLRECIDGRRGQ